VGGLENEEVVAAATIEHDARNHAFRNAAKRNTDAVDLLHDIELPAGARIAFGDKDRLIVAGACDAQNAVGVQGQRNRKQTPRFKTLQHCWLLRKKMSVVADYRKRDAKICTCRFVANAEESPM